MLDSIITQQVDVNIQPVDTRQKNKTRKENIQGTLHKKSIRQWYKILGKSYNCDETKKQKNKKRTMTFFSFLRVAAGAYASYRRTIKRRATTKQNKTEGLGAFIFFLKHITLVKENTASAYQKKTEDEQFAPLVANQLRRANQREHACFGL